MADQQLNIKLNVIDNASKAFTDVKNSIFNVRNALLSIGAGVAIKSLIDVGKQTDTVRTRLDELAKSGYGGSDAFDQLTKFAIKSKIPLLDVLQASGDLLSISKSPQELAKNLEIASNASARFGISFTDSSDQLAKAFLKGIDSARLFSDRGIRSIDQFGQFADVSISNLPLLFDKVFGANGTFGKANENLKKGLNGTVISLNNIFTELQVTIAKGFFGTLTRELGELEKFFLNNRQAINEFGKSLGEILAVGILKLSNAVVFLKNNFEFLLNLFYAFLALKIVLFIAEVVTAIKTLTVAITALNLAGSKGKFLSLLVAIGASVGGIYLAKKGFDETKDSLDKLNDTDLDLFGEGTSYAENPALKQAIDIGKIFENIGVNNRKNLKDLNDLYGTTAGITKTITDGLNKGISDFSQGIAESIVLGKQLDNVFRGIVNQILIAILKQSIELLARQAILAVEKLITQEKIAQASVSTASSLGSNFFGTIARIGFNAFAGGGSVPLDAPNLYSPTMEAEGGSVRGGMPITVGERGRELFVPSTSGTIVPNHDMANTGTNITFNIQANDVRGIRELLIDNRATIINLVNQGANQKGKSNVV
jgi:hypothetical protein